ncbi:hypothetical protein GOODEAATRI_026870 [Goodea atripinnis]|uniref:Uncharacterized protein n=1 Tax=Goodea atripinnis TaxID=208336 RepID=A0ABV0NY38_9TELE
MYCISANYSDFTCTKCGDRHLQLQGLGCCSRQLCRYPLEVGPDPILVAGECHSKLPCQVIWAGGPCGAGKGTSLALAISALMLGSMQTSVPIPGTSGSPAHKMVDYLSYIWRRGADVIPVLASEPESSDSCLAQKSSSTLP